MRWRERRGQSLILVAGALVALMGVAGMAVDTGSWYVTREHLRNALDAAALAGAHDLPGNSTQAVTDAISAASRNGITLTPADVTVSSANPDELIVTGGTTAPTYFTRLFGMNGVHESAIAKAQDTYSIALDYALFSTSTTTPITETGNTTVNGNVHANYNNPPVAEIGNPHINGMITGTPVIAVPSPTWSQIEAENPVIIPNGESSSDANAGDPAGTACENTYSIAGNSSALPSGGVVVVMGNIDISGDIQFSGTLIAWGGDITLSGNVSAASGGPAALMALNNPVETTGACAGNQGGITLEGNVSVSGAVWAGGPVDFKGHDTVDGSVVADTISENGDDTVTWDPNAAGAMAFRNPWLVP